MTLAIFGGSPVASSDGRPVLAALNLVGALARHGLRATSMPCGPDGAAVIMHGTRGPIIRVQRRTHGRGFVYAWCRTAQTPHEWAADVCLTGYVAARCAGLAGMP